MLRLVTIILFLTCSFAIAQDKYICRDGNIHFEASVPSFEPVAAKSNTASAILNVKTGDFAALVLVKSFRFKLALMEEHFNENYMNSSRFPKITFKGNIADLKRLSKSEKTFPIKGILEVRGVQKEIATTALLIKESNTIILKTSFEANPEDFGIKIPKVVSKKIAKTVIITPEFVLKK